MPKMVGNGRGMIKVNGYDEFNPDINLARGSTLKKKIKRIHHVASLSEKEKLLSLILT